MKLYFNGFWNGFHDGRDAVTDKFFINLMTNVYETENIQITFDIDQADILIENTQITNSFLNYKSWKHTYLFSGESYLHKNADKYSCVLYGSRNHRNIINVPLYIPYYISSFNESYITENKIKPVQKVPDKDVLIIISNKNGEFRNKFIEILEQNMDVTFAGCYKNNIGGAFLPYYNTEEFQEYVGKFKFIVAMENSQEDTYITEKITHGILGGSIPIYWGSKRITDYFNSDRFIKIDNHSDIESVIIKMKTMTQDNWLQIVNQKPFTEFGKNYTIKTISKHIRNLLNSNAYVNLTQTYILCNEIFEPERYKKMQILCQRLSLSKDNYKFISSTYKNNISDNIMKLYVKDDIVLKVRPYGMKKAEISLFLNFKEILQDIEKTYKDGIFLILESDVFTLSTIKDFNQCINILKDKEWSTVNIGGDSYDINKSRWLVSLISRPYRSECDKPDIDLYLQQPIEDLNDCQDNIRFIRNFKSNYTDAQLWSYKGCIQFLEYMNTDANYCVPLDFYINHKCEIDMNFKYYISIPNFFDQESIRGLDTSTIQ
jgi:hypothetical protein